MMQAGDALPEAPSHACCTSLHVLHTPKRGQFGFPTTSILGEYTSDGPGQPLRNVLTNVTLRNVKQDFMGGLRWAFISGSRHYLAFSTVSSACAEDAHTWRYWQVNRYREGSFHMACAPVEETEQCCPDLRVLHAPSRGVFGAPSASLLGRYRWTSGGYDCTDCVDSVALEPVSETWMGGTRWTFITHGKQYPVFAAADASCPAAAAGWKFWDKSAAYRDGAFLLQCGEQEVCCAALRVVDAPQGGSFGLPAVNVLGSYVWSSGKYDCSDCAEPVTLEPVSEARIGGTRWTFITHGKQFVAFAGSSRDCAAGVPSWKYWNAGQGYTRGAIQIECVVSSDGDGKVEL